MEDTRTFKDINRIAIVGAGNAGVTAAKYLLAENAFAQIDVFEQRSRAGGLWIYNPVNEVEDDFSIPQTTATAPLETPKWRDSRPTSMREQNGNTENTVKEPTFNSPLYERLESNLPKTIMRYSDLAFPADAQLYPTHEAVLEYLDRYTNDVRHLIHFENQIEEIYRRIENGKTTWYIDVHDLASSQRATYTYDAVVIASGHFIVPYVPDISGIQQWNKTYPNSMSHSKHFRRPEEYRGKKIISVGRGFSGLDIASQLAEVSAKPLIISTYQPGGPDPGKSYVQRPEIAECLPPSPTTNRAVRFVDGHIETDIDHILFCTGYMYSFAYLPTFTSPQTQMQTQTQAQPASPVKAPATETAANPPIITDGARPHNLYQYIFYNADPTLAVICMPQQIVPFPIAEAQSAVVARAWAGRLTLPSRLEMIRWEEKTVRELGDGKKWLWLKTPRDGHYLNGLADWAETATGVGGRPPPRWGEEDFWVRKRVMDIKSAFAARGEGRREITTLEELGFDFGAWKRMQNEVLDGGS